MGEDTTMDALLVMVEQCSSKCLQHAIDKNGRLIGELLIKMIIKSKYNKNSIDNIFNKNKSNQKQHHKNKNQNKNKNNNNNNVSTKRGRGRGKRNKSNSNVINSKTMNDNDKPKSKNQLKTLFKSLTKSTYQPRKQSSDDNDNSDSIHIGLKNISFHKSNSKQTKEISMTNAGIDQVIAPDTDSDVDSSCISSDSDMNDSIDNTSEINAPLASQSNHCSNSPSNCDINKISDDSLKIILLFVTPYDIYFENYSEIYSSLTAKSRTMYTVSKRFNLLLKQIHNNKHVSHSIVPGHQNRHYPIGFSLSHNIRYNFGHGMFLTLDQLYKLKQEEYHAYEDLGLEIQSPNGKICKIKLKSYPWPLTNNPKDIEMTGKQENDDNYHSYYESRYNRRDRDNFDVEMGSDNQVFYQNSKFRKHVFKKQDLTKQTLTNFMPRNSFGIRQIKYDVSNLNKFIKHLEDKIQLVDINLQALYNHYIFCTYSWELYCGLSIAQIAIFLTKRKWVVGVCDTCPKGSQISFQIDITEEINAIKSAPKEKTKKLIITNKGKESKNKSNVNISSNISRATSTPSTIVESNVNDKTLGLSNIHVLIRDQDGNYKVDHYRMYSDEAHESHEESKYYGTFYAQLDDSCIINMFGTRTNNMQHRDIHKRYYPRYGMRDTFFKFKHVEEFDIDKMYQYSSLVKNDNQIVDEIKDIGYVLIDSKVYGNWTCGILMKHENINDKEVFVKHSDELRGHVGLLKVKRFSNTETPHQYEDVIHLDNATEVDYFGKQSSSQHQKHLIKMIFKHFSDARDKKCKHLKQLLNL